jgi:ribonuclease E
MLDENDSTTTSTTSDTSPETSAESSRESSRESSPDTSSENGPAAPVVKKTTRRAPRKSAKKAAPAPETAQPAAHETAERGAVLTAEQLAGDEETASPGAPAGEPTSGSADGPAAGADTGADAGAAISVGRPAEAEQPSMQETAERGAELTAEQVSGAEETAAPGDAPAKRTARKTAAKKAPAKKAAAKKTTTRKTAASRGAAKQAAAEAPAQDSPAPAAGSPETDAPAPGSTSETADAGGETTPVIAAPAVLFKAPDPVAAPRRRRKAAAAPPEQPVEAATEDEAGADGTAADAAADTVSATTVDDTTTADATATDPTIDAGVDAEALGDEQAAATTDEAQDSDDESEEQGGNRRRRRRGGRRRRRGGAGEDGDGASDTAEDAEAEQETPDTAAAEAPEADTETEGRSGGRGRGRRGSRADRSKAEEQDAEEQEEGTGSRRRRRRRRSGEDGDGAQDDPQNTVVRVRRPRSPEDEITSLHGSTRLEAKKQRRREGREAGRRRAPIVSEAEFLARREAVERVMAIRQHKDLTQIAVLEDKVLVEHYVARESQTSLIGNVYLGRVQNVLPSMEAAFIDIGKGRNAVLYAGEVNWDALGAGNGPRKIEQVLKSGQSILVQVSKDPIGHKGARLTSQVSLPGRFLVYVPDGTTSGISRKLPDTERSRLKTLLKEIVPDTAGVIVRTAAEGASEEELTHDVERLTARWSDIESRAQKGNAPQLLYGEPDLTLKVVRDLFTEDFVKLVVSGDDAWNMVEDYVQHVAPDLEERLERYTEDDDVFAAYRIDEQIAKGLDRKVWLPSGGSLVIDRTEAMTVVDVNTGKFTGSGGNLEETVTKNNLEAAEEIVRQLRLRDIGGIIVVDFIDMVLESNRDLVLRRLVECLGRDRTRHQVAEVTSLGLVQMTRKRIGTGLLEAFSETCEHCQGRGVVIHHEPVEPRRSLEDEPRRGRRGRSRSGEQEGAGNGGSNGNGGGNGGGRGNGNGAGRAVPSPKDLAAMAKHEPKPADTEPADTEPADTEPADNGSVDTQPADLQQPADQAGSPDTPKDSPAVTPVGSVVDISAHSPVEPEVLAAAAEAETLSEPTQDVPEQPAEPTQPAAPVVPAGPRLVTSTRRRVARRPAGPPSGSASPDASAPNASASPDASANGASGSAGTPEDQGPGAAETQEPPSEQVHVPVKKRGRKR